MAACGDYLVEHQAALVEVSDLVFHRDDVYRVYDVDADPLRGRVTIRLEACRWGDLNVPLTAPVLVEKLS